MTSHFQTFLISIPIWEHTEERNLLSALNVTRLFQTVHFNSHMGTQWWKIYLVYWVWQIIFKHFQFQISYENIYCASNVTSHCHFQTFFIPIPIWEHTEERHLLSPWNMARLFKQLILFSYGKTKWWKIYLVHWVWHIIFKQFHSKFSYENTFWRETF